MSCRNSLQAFVGRSIRNLRVEAQEARNGSSVKKGGELGLSNLCGNSDVKRTWAIFGAPKERPGRF